MAAMLERNGKDRKPAPGNIPAKEIVPCSIGDCDVSYTLSYTDDENFMRGNERNVDVISRTAAERVEEGHPAHTARLYLWKAVGEGSWCRWFEADSLAARRAI
jgi:hypothetical protein